MHGHKRLPSGGHEKPPRTPRRPSQEHCRLASRSSPGLVGQLSEEGLALQSSVSCEDPVQALRWEPLVPSRQEEHPSVWLVEGERSEGTS